MSLHKNQKNILLKTLLYRSVHRGCKETDILLGKFAQNKINDLSDLELQIYEKFIIEDDAMIYDWILDKAPIPKNYQDLVINIRQFHNL